MVLGLGRLVVRPADDELVVADGFARRLTHPRIEVGVFQPAVYVQEQSVRRVPRRHHVVPAAGQHVVGGHPPLLTVLTSETALEVSAVVEHRDAVALRTVAAVRHEDVLVAVGRLVEVHPHPDRVSYCTFVQISEALLPMARSRHPYVAVATVDEHSVVTRTSYERRVSDPARVQSRRIRDEIRRNDVIHRQLIVSILTGDAELFLAVALGLSAIRAQTHTPGAARIPRLAYVVGVGHHEAPGRPRRNPRPQTSAVPVDDVPDRPGEPVGEDDRRIGELGEPAAAQRVLGRHSADVDVAVAAAAELERLAEHDAARRLVVDLEERLGALARHLYAVPVAVVDVVPEDQVDVTVGLIGESQHEPDAARVDDHDDEEVRVAAVVGVPQRHVRRRYRLRRLELERERGVRAAGPQRVASVRLLAAERDRVDGRRDDEEEDDGGGQDGDDGPREKKAQREDGGRRRRTADRGGRARRRHRRYRVGGGPTTMRRVFMNVHRSTTCKQV